MNSSINPSQTTHLHFLTLTICCSTETGELGAWCHQWSQSLKLQLLTFLSRPAQCTGHNFILWCCPKLKWWHKKSHTLKLSIYGWENRRMKRISRKRLYDAMIKVTGQKRHQGQQIYRLRAQPNTSNLFWNQFLWVVHRSSDIRGISNRLRSWVTWT